MIDRASAALGVPVKAAAKFQVEGLLPWVWGGFAVGGGVGFYFGLQSAFLPTAIGGGPAGVLVGLLTAGAVARRILWSRFRTVGFAPVLAVTDDGVQALNFLPRVPSALVGSWPAKEVADRIRRKRLTIAVTLDAPQGHQIRLEMLGYGKSRRNVQAFVSSLQACAAQEL